MKVLIACEFSGVVREAFRKRGHDAWSCDLLPSEDGSGFHLRMDIKDVLNPDTYMLHIDPDWMDWDLMIAHPPCTRLCNSGVMWLEKRNLWENLIQSILFFNDLLNAPIPKICIENPIPHKYAVAGIGKYNQLIQPWQFGHGETKATCLWLKNLPKLKPTNIVSGREQRLHRLPPSKDRSKLRSITYQGIADAMAEQWGGLN